VVQGLVQNFLSKGVKRFNYMGIRHICASFSKRFTKNGSKRNLQESPVVTVNQTLPDKTSVEDSTVKASHPGLNRR